MWGNNMIIKKKPESQQYQSFQSYGWGMTDFGAFNQQQMWGQGFSGFGQPNNNGFIQPGMNNNGFLQPNNSGFTQPANGFGNSGFAQPQNTFGQQGNNGFVQPQNNGFVQPNNNAGFVQPNNNAGFVQPNNNAGFVQPQNNGFAQPNNNAGFVQPNNNGFVQPNNNAGFVKPNNNNVIVQPGMGQGNNNVIPQNNNNLGNNGNQGGNNIQPLNPGTIGNFFGNNLQGNQWIQHQQSKNSFEMLDGGKFDLGKYIQAQVIQVEPSPQKQKIQELKKYKKGDKFVDQRFPPNDKSLSGEWGPLSQWKQVKWVKLSQKLPGGKIFIGKPSPNDIKQGYLGDCYYLAGLTALAQRPDRIFNLFLETQRNPQQFYSVKLLYKGKWVTIDMDQYIPFLYNSPAFTKAVSNSLWVVLLEKAWAKMYTSYRRIEAGYPEQPLHDLTGAPIRQIYVKSASFSKQQEWNYLLLASSLEYSMVCSSNPGSDSNKSQSGVVQGHAYTVLEAINLTFDGKQHRLIKLRNPWGKGEFKGQWSDDDPNWLKIDAEQKQRLGFQKAEDGVFFIPYDTFLEQFQTITVAEINDDASYLFKSHKDPKCQGCYFKIEIKKEGTYSLQIDKPPERSLQQKRQQAYRYARATVTIGLNKNGKVQKLQGFASDERTSQKKYKFKEGTYLVKVLISYNAEYQKDYDVNLAVYAQFPCLITYASSQEANLLAGKQVNWTPKQQTASSNAPEPWNDLACYGWNENKGVETSNVPNTQKNNNMVNANSAFHDTGSAGFSNFSNNQILPEGQVHSSNRVQPAKSWCCFF